MDVFSGWFERFDVRRLGRILLLFIDFGLREVGVHEFCCRVGKMFLLPMLQYLLFPGLWWPCCLLTVVGYKVLCGECLSPHSRIYEYGKI